MNRSRSSILAAGIGLILLTNAVALGGVAWNRSGEPDSVLRLTGRELQRPHDWERDRENSGLVLALRWRTPGQDVDSRAGMHAGDDNAGGAHTWLNETKLKTLGFDTRLRRRADGRPDIDRPREVLLVLEWNGPAYQQSLERERERASHEEALRAAHPDNEEMARRANAAKTRLAREENEFSRLFVVDAGLDAMQLRSAYPDRSRYAIVRGEVRPHGVITDKAMPALAGYVSGIYAERINVPLAFQPAFAPGAASQQQGKAARAAPGEITVAFGRRLEPWIVGATWR